MPWQYDVYVTFVSLGAIVCAYYSVVAWRQRSTPGASGLTLLLLAVTLWCSLVTVELLSQTPSATMFWAQAEYVGIAFGPLAVFVFVLQLTGYSRWLTPRHVSILSIIPIISVLMAWTTGKHGLLWSTYDFPRIGSFTVMQINRYGRWFYIHVTYSYLLITISIVLLILAAFRRRGLYRRQGTGHYHRNLGAAGGKRAVPFAYYPGAGARSDAAGLPDYGHDLDVGFVPLPVVRRYAGGSRDGFRRHH